jgi:hypothetical protein
MKDALDTKNECPSISGISMSTKMAAQQQYQRTPPPKPAPYVTTSMLLVLFRGPVLWLLGISLLVGFCISTWKYMPHTALVPLILVIIIGSIIVWTVVCGVYFTMDIYTTILRPIVLQPAIVSATKYSLDDILTVLCDPTQFATFISALFVLPVTLYTLPTTTQQRAQVLSAAGVIPTLLYSESNVDNAMNTENSIKILTQPGGWVYLFPERMQQFVHRAMQHSSNSNHIGRMDHEFNYDQLSNNLRIEETTLIDGTLYHDVTCASTDDDDEDDEDCNRGYSQETTGCRMHHSSTSSRRPPNISNVDINVGGATPIPNTSTSSEQKSFIPNDHHSDLQQLLLQILIDLSQNRFDKFCHGLQLQHSNMVVTAIAAVTVLVIQIRHSSTARSIFKNVVHLLLTTGAGIALMGSVIALITPYLNEKLRQDQQQRTPYTRRNDVNRNFGTNNSIRKHWSFLVSTFMTTAAISVPNAIPAIPTKAVSEKVKRFLLKWKGTLAIFVITYFQYRHDNRRMLRGKNPMR